MIRRHRFHIAWAIAILLVLGVALSQARVYRRWQGTSRVDATLAALGATPVYETAATVNQAAGQLSVFGFEQGLSDVAARMGRELKLDDWYQGGNMVMGSVADGREVSRILAMTVMPERTVVVTFRAAARDMEAAQKPVNIVWPDGLPLYPGSTPTLQASLEQAGVEWLTADAPTDADTAQRNLRDALLHDGWHPVATSGAGNDHACFERGNATCWIWAVPSEEGLHSTTALLYRKAKE